MKKNLLLNIDTENIPGFRKLQKTGFFVNDINKLVER